MKCADPTCNAKATRELLGIAMCDAYYLEALEHSAHLNFGQWDGKSKRFFEEVIPRPEEVKP